MKWPFALRKTVDDFEAIAAEALRIAQLEHTRRLHAELESRNWENLWKETYVQLEKIRNAR